MKKIISLLLVLLLVLTTACSGKTANTDKPSTTDVTEGGKYDAVQEYKTVYAEEIQTINYLTTATTVEFALAANLVDTLVDYDKYGVVQPCLAESWEVSDDNLTWTFHLRKGVKWVDVDGKEVAETTANDFVDAAKYLLDKNNESATAELFYGVIKNAEAYFNGEITDFSQVGVKAVDDYTLQYTLKEPTPYFESMLTYVCFFPVYGKFLAEQGDSFGTTNTALLYNGAYILSEYEPQMQRILTKNPTYWDKDNVFIEKLSYKYNKEATSLEAEMYKRGEVSTVQIPASGIDQWMNDAALKAQVRPGTLGSYTYFYAFNFEPKMDAQYEPENWKLAVNNSNFRKSIQSGFNRVAAMKTEEPYNPEYRIINTITPPNFAAGSGTDYTKTGDLKAVSENKDFFDEKAALDYKEKAKAELTAAGATFPVKILMPYNTSGSSWANEAQVVKQQLETLLGTDFIEITLLPHAPTGFLDATRRAGNYSIMKCNWGPDYADPQTYTDPFDKESNYNFPEFITEKNADGKTLYEPYFDMVTKAKAETVDIAKRYELFADAEAYLINNAFVIPYNVSGGGFYASKINPFEAPYSPFGVSAERWKGQKILAKPMNTEEFNQAMTEWQAARDAAIKAAASK